MNTHLLSEIEEHLKDKPISDNIKRYYLSLIQHYLNFHQQRQPQDLGATEMANFYYSLEAEGRSQGQLALAQKALVLLYCEVLHCSYERCQISSDGKTGCFLA